MLQLLPVLCELSEVSGSTRFWTC